MLNQNITKSAGITTERDGRTSSRTWSTSRTSETCHSSGACEARRASHTVLTCPAGVAHSSCVSHHHKDKEVLSFNVQKSCSVVFVMWWRYVYQQETEMKFSFIKDRFPVEVTILFRRKWLREINNRLMTEVMSIAKGGLEDLKAPKFQKVHKWQILKVVISPHPLRTESLSLQTKQWLVFLLLYAYGHSSFKKFSGVIPQTSTVGATSFLTYSQH